MKNSLNYMLSFMKEIMDIPSPGGYTDQSLAFIEIEFKKLGLDVVRNKKNAIYATIKGRNDDNHKMIVGHVDTLGAIVKEIKPNGRLILAQIGGYAWNAVEGENILVHRDNGAPISGTLLPEHASIHIQPEKVRQSERTDDFMEVRLDAFTNSTVETLALGIKVGDFVSYDPRFTICGNGYIKSRYLDDKSAVAIIMGLCKHIKENNIIPKYTLHFCISNYEEIGHGVSLVPAKTDELIAIDIGPVGIGQSSKETSVSIAAKDSRTPYDYSFRKALTDVCIKYQIDYQVDVYNRYGSDASVGVLQGLDVNFACVGPGVDATHHYERTHISAIENTALLLLKYAVED